MKINLQTLDKDKIIEHINKKDISICVIGIGRIGLPTALSFAKSGFKTIGIDINEDLVTSINSGEFPLKDEPDYDKIFDEVIKNETFHATTQIEEIVPITEVILLSLPTPMNEQNIPDYSALKTVGTQLSNLLTQGSLVIVESTVEPGFIENEFIPIIEENSKKFKAGVDFEIGVCPETANPGEILKDFQNLPRLVGSINEKTVEVISKLYENVFGVELIKMPDCKTANAVKLTTNVFRDINIAFVNELALLYEKLDIDILTVLDAAKRKYNFQVHYPGAGVGGPCLPVNSYQLLNTEKKLNENILSIVDRARKTNEKMPLHVIDLLENAFYEIGEQLENKIICILGISYKPNVKDIQISPAETIIKELDKKNTVKIFDPYFSNAKVFSKNIEKNILEALENSDCAIIVTGHKEFQSIKPSLFASKLKFPILVDCTGIVDINEAKQSGLIYRGVGRGQKSKNE